MTEMFQLTANGKKMDYSMSEDNLTLAQLERFQVLDCLKTNGSATLDQIVKFTKMGEGEVSPIIQDFKRGGLVVVSSRSN